MTSSLNNVGIWAYVPRASRWVWHSPKNLDRAELELRRMGCYTYRGSEMHKPTQKPLRLRKWVEDVVPALHIMTDNEVLQWNR